MASIHYCGGVVVMKTDSPIKPSDRIIKVNEVDDTFWGHRKDTYVFREVEYVLTAQKYILPKEVSHYQVALDSVGYVIDTRGNITRDLSQAFVFKVEMIVCIQEFEKHESNQFCWAGEHNQINFCKNGLAVSSYPKDKAQQWLDNHPLPRKGISKMTRGNVYSRFNGRCAYCGCEIELSEMQVDHFIPYMGLGGEDTLDNYYPACQVCNRVKSNRTIDGFKNAIRHCGEIHRKRKKPIMADSDKIAIKYDLTQEDHEIVLFFEKYNDMQKVNVGKITEALNNEGQK